MASRAQGASLAGHLGAVRDRVPCGVSVGIAASPEAMLEEIDGYLAKGYQRVKLKIEPGRDVAVVRAVREALPDTPLSVDANAAYTLADAPLFEALDELDLVMIEQPLGHDDLVDHAQLQARLRTPICLDESIRHAHDAAAAIELGACRIINIKPGRVGGLLEAKRVHDVARERDVPVWIGGMLETGIGRATNVAMAALPGVTMPGDTSASERYFHRDLTAAVRRGARRDHGGARPDRGSAWSRSTDALEESHDPRSGRPRWRSCEGGVTPGGRALVPLGAIVLDR